MKPKLYYIMPEYRRDASTHFAYIPEFLSELSGELDIFLLIEKGEKPSHSLGLAGTALMHFHFVPLRFLETLLRLTLARFQGYKDFYIHYSFFATFAAALVARLSGGRVFYWNCGLPWKYRRGFLRERFERLTYKLITFLVTGTEGMKRKYAEHYGISLKKIKVMPNWIDLGKIKNQNAKIKIKELRESLEISETAKIVLFAHRLSKRKGAHFLPEIIQSFEGEDVVFVIIGDGPERKTLTLSISNNQLLNKARFLGWKPHKEVLKYFAIADVFIMPSEEEGFPHVLLETMAIGVPFVAFGVGGVEEITPSELSEYVVSPDDVGVFTKKLREALFLDDEDRRRIQEIESAWVRQFDVKKVSERFKEIILNE